MRASLVLSMSLISFSGCATDAAPPRADASSPPVVLSGVDAVHPIQSTPMGELRAAGVLDLVSTPLVEGEVAMVTVSGAAPGAQISLLVSTNIGGPPACPPVIAPDCLDLAPQVTLVDQRAADATGTAVFTITPPTGVPAARVQLQAAVMLVGGGADTSTAPVLNLHDASSDADADGLAAVDELLWGTDPDLADSDGGGTLDGAEVAAGSDPLDPSDDVAPITWDDDIWPLLDQRCGGCHMNGGSSGGLALDRYSDVVGMPSVAVPSMDEIEPGLPADSYIWHKLLGSQGSVGGSGDAMPPAGTLVQSELDLIEDWILAGALE